ncbi:MAG: hypothetical protein JNL42_21865 [Anaerolineae bacterium]|nr:hypothetical protein [Anaerolineae bacterium]
MIGLIVGWAALAGGALAQDAPRYPVEIEPEDFVTVVDNPYLPLKPGSRWVYEGTLLDGTVEHNEVEVLSETRLIQGVTTTVVRDTVVVDGVIVEATLDFYAQDEDGNVWYFGEEVQNYVNGVFENTGGSWMAGADGAEPGLVMFAVPSAHVGETFQQEYYPGEAEDRGVLLSVTGSAEVPAGAFEALVLTYDFTPLDPEAHEIKYYAEGVGAIKTIDLTTGETFELIAFNGA